MAESAPPAPAPSGLVLPVFLSSAGVLLALVLFAGLFLQPAAAAFTAAQAWVIESFGGFYMLAVAIFVIACVVLAFGRHGAVRLGRDEETPEFGNGSWFATLFSVGMGIGLMFFGVAEPVMHYAAPRPTPMATRSASARRGRRWSPTSSTGACMPGRSMRWSGWCWPISVSGAACR
ncbi:BCCT family transporter [Falsiroseomonas tokyonensis]|uniref:BCCT family transporter n=1 Tax=Falsiroseomonas tokyonensis TaxID=430521 RepID=A0ABV7C209_9PROT|nr:BCCT family transporter [Falsiroseomonas tokyonensis]MBU8540341.1 BCCT family transporter [Falsiroseomonas tokyonensis]